MNAEDVLLRAAEVIEARGWHQGAYVDPATGAVCAMGAVNVVVSSQPEWSRLGPDEVKLAKVARDLLAARLATWQDWENSVTSWNDSQGRTREQVLEALRG